MKWETPQEPNPSIIKDDNVFTFWLLKYFQAFQRNDYNFEHVTTITSSSNISLDVTLVLCDCTSGNITATLPAQTELGFPKKYIFVKTDSSSNTLSLATADTATIKSSASLPFSGQYNWVELVTDGTDWIGVSGFINSGGSFRGCLAYGVSDPMQSLTHNTSTKLNFDGEIYDTDSIHDTVTNTSRLTVPSGATKARLTAQVAFAANGTGYRSVIIKDDVAIDYIFHGHARGYQDGSASYDTYINITTPVINVGSSSYFELEAFQNSGGSLSVRGYEDTWFAMEIIE